MIPPPVVDRAMRTHEATKSSETGEEHLPPPEHVAERTRRHDHRGADEHVAGHRPLQLRHRRAGVLAHRRQQDRDGRGVRVDHERRHARSEEDGEPGRTVARRRRTAAASRSRDRYPIPSAGRGPDRSRSLKRRGRITVATISPYAIAIAVTNVSNPASIPLTVCPVRSFSRLSKPALPGTRISTPGTMKTSGERRRRAPRSPPTTPIASAATKTPAAAPRSDRPAALATIASTVAQHITGAARHCARSVTVNASPAAIAARTCVPLNAVCAIVLLRDAEPAHRDRATDGRPRRRGRAAARARSRCSPPPTGGAPSRARAPRSSAPCRAAA